MSKKVSTELTDELSDTIVCEFFNGLWEKCKPILKSERFITGIIMVTIYLGMAFLLVFTTLFVGKVPEWVRYMMGVVFFLYGIYRGYRVYVSRK